MLSEVAAEALNFLTRRDLDKACGVSKWLDAMIARSCEVYPLRQVDFLALALYGSDFSVSFYGKGISRSSSFSTVDEAVHLVGSTARHSYVESFQLDLDNSALSPDNWATLMDAIRSGAVRGFSFVSVDLSALNGNAFLEVVDCVGLEGLTVRESVFSPGFAADDLIRSSAAKGFRTLSICDNRGDSLHGLPDDVVLDYFSADVAPGLQWLSLDVDGSGVSDSFLVKLFDRLRSNPIRRDGSLKLFGAAKQRGLSAYTANQLPGEAQGLNPTYRFPPEDDDGPYCEVELCQRSSYVLWLMYYNFHW